MIDAEIVDLELDVNEGDALAAPRDALGRDDEPEAAVEITGLWSIWFGNQVATAKDLPEMLKKLDKITVGWTISKLRSSPLRREEPKRCYKYHGFRHTISTCASPNLVRTCRKCGEVGHKENVCKEQEKCVHQS